MQDYYNLILLGEYGDDEIEKMLGKHNLLEELVDLWNEDDRVLELMKILLREYLATRY